MTKKSRAVIIVACAALLWSTGGFFIKYIDWDGMSIAGGRSIIAALTICILLRRPPLLMKNRYAWAGVVAYALLVTAYVVATKLTTAANSILLQYMAPIYVAILAPFFLKEPTRKGDWLFICLALCGMVLFFIDSLHPDGLQGNLLAVFSGFCFAWFCMLLRKAPAQLTVDIVVWGNILTFILCLPFMDFANLPSREGCIALVAMGIFQLGVGYYMYTKGVAYLRALEMILIPTIEPVLNPLLVAVIIGEIPGPWSIVGGLMVLCIVCIWSIIKIKREQA